MARRHRSTPDRWVDSQGRVIDEEDRGLVYDCLLYTSDAADD